MSSDDCPVLMSAIPIRRKRASTVLAKAAMNPIVTTVMEMGNRSIGENDRRSVSPMGDSSDQEGSFGDSPPMKYTTSIKCTRNSEPVTANKKRTKPRKIVRQQTVEVQDFAMQYHASDDETN